MQGLVVPGMPRGAPGMEGPEPESYDVLSLGRDGRTAGITNYGNYGNYGVITVTLYHLRYFLPKVSH